jgi:PmbA protein
MRHLRRGRCEADGELGLWKTTSNIGATGLTTREGIPLAVAPLAAARRCAVAKADRMPQFRLRGEGPQRRMESRVSDQALDLLDDLLTRARKAGADAADALLVEGTSLSVQRRLGTIERVERAESRDLGLRFFVGRRVAILSTSELSPKGLLRLVEQAAASARNLPEDPHAGLADPDQIAREIPDLDLFDDAEPSAEALIALAAAAEDSALAVPGITNSEGAEAGFAKSTIALAASNGFRGAYRRARHSVSAVAIAGEGTGMERDYEYSQVVHPADLDDPALIGRRAAERALRRLGPRKMPTRTMPVVLEPRVAGSIVRHLTTAIAGPAVARGTSFLKDRLGEPVMARGITIVDDPLRPKGLRSSPFDAEGLSTRRRALVENGVLTTWLLDLASARKLGQPPTGHASRGVSSPPAVAPHNAYVEPGAPSPAELMSDIEDGLYITEMIGMGVSYITGDYSRGAAGFRIEKGEIGPPVSGITVAGNLKEILMGLAAASDLELRYGIDAPTLRIDGLTVAGQ